MSSGGMSLGETLLASAAGAMIGAYIVINFLTTVIIKVKDEPVINHHQHFHEV